MRIDLKRRASPARQRHRRHVRPRHLSAGGADGVSGLRGRRTFPSWAWAASAPRGGRAGADAGRGHRRGRRRRQSGRALRLPENHTRTCLPPWSGTVFSRLTGYHRRSTSWVKTLSLHWTSTAGRKRSAFLDRFTEEKPFVKVGMELFYAEGPAIVREIRRRGHQHLPGSEAPRHPQHGEKGHGCPVGAGRGHRATSTPPVPPP